MATPAQPSSPATALPMLVMKQTLSHSISSYPPLFVASQNTTFLSSKRSNLGKGLVLSHTSHCSSY